MQIDYPINKEILEFNMQGLCKHLTKCTFTFSEEKYKFSVSIGVLKLGIFNEPAEQLIYIASTACQHASKTEGNSHYIWKETDIAPELDGQPTDKEPDLKTVEEKENIETELKAADEEKKKNEALIQAEKKAREKLEAELKIAAETKEKAEAELKIAAETKEKAEAEAKTLAEKEARRNAESEFKAQEEINLRAVQKEKEEAELKIEEETKAKTKAELRADQEVQQRIQAELKAEEEVKAKDQALLRADQEAQQRIEAELKAEEEVKAKDQAMLRAGQEAQQRIEAAAKAKDQAVLRADQEAKEKAEAELKAMREEKAKFEAELRAEHEAQQRIEAELRAENETEAKLQAEQEIKKTSSSLKAENSNAAEHTETSENDSTKNQKENQAENDNESQENDSTDIKSSELLIQETEVKIRKLIDEKRIIQTYQAITAMFEDENGIKEIYKTGLQAIVDDNELNQYLSDTSVFSISLQQTINEWVLRQVFLRITESGTGKCQYLFLIKVTESWFSDSALFNWLQKILAQTKKYNPGKSIILDVPLDIFNRNKKRAQALIGTLHKSHQFSIALSNIHTFDNISDDCALSSSSLLMMNIEQLKKLTETPAPHSEEDEGKKEDAEETPKQNMLQYLKSKGIRIIASGIEDSTLLMEAITAGTDYTLGNFVGEVQDNLVETSAVESFELT